MKKNTSSTVRINKEIKDLLMSNGITVQKIIDDYIRENIKIETIIKKQKKEIDDQSY